MLSIPVFSNAQLASADQPLIHLVEPRVGGRMSERDVRRAIERFQTMSFVHAAQAATGSASVYALEELMTANDPALQFPADRPKLCDRMARLGQPAVVKQLAPSGRKDLRTKRWIDRLVALAPGAAQVMSFPLWRLLSPQPVGHVDWHELGWIHGQQHLAKMTARNEEVGPAAAWQVTFTPSDSESETEHFVGYVGHAPDLHDLTGQLLGLRRWEAAGDLIAYDLTLHQILRAACHSSAAPDLSALQPKIGQFIARCFGTVVVPHPDINLEYQRERLAKGREAWEKRTLIGNGVGLPGFDASV